MTIRLAKGNCTLRALRQTPPQRNPPKPRSKVTSMFASSRFWPFSKKTKDDIEATQRQQRSTTTAQRHTPSYSHPRACPHVWFWPWANFASTKPPPTKTAATTTPTTTMDEHISSACAPLCVAALPPDIGSRTRHAAVPLQIGVSPGGLSQQ